MELSIEVSYQQDSTGWHTGATYRGADGIPMASRFPGRLSKPEVISYIEASRRQDRNRSPNSA